jgi:hypothetical protein
VNCAVLYLPQLAIEMASGPKMDMYAQDATRAGIYTYEAPWLIYGMNWSVRRDSKFRLGVGSFIEEYRNKVTELLQTSSLLHFAKH